MRRAMKTIQIILLCFLALAAAPPPQAAEQSPLDRRLRLNLWGAGLKDVAAAVKQATDVDIVFYLPDLPGDANTDNVYLVTGDVPLATVLETLARRFGFRFRVAETGRVELSLGYGWAPREPALRFARLDGGLSTPTRDGTPEAEREFFDELLKPLPLLSGDFTLRLERYPLPGLPGALRAAVVLPGELGDYFVRGVRCLSGEAGDFPAPRGGADGAARTFARAREYSPDWEDLLTRPVEIPQPPQGGGGALRALLAGVAAQTGAAVALRAPPGAAERMSLPADVFRYTLGRICETLSVDFALGKRVFLASGGVVFERGAEGGDGADAGGPAIEMDSRSRELFWSGLAVAGWNAGAAAERAGGAEALLGRIRREVFPGVWRDPVCALLYSPATRRVSAVAPLNVIEKIGALMKEL